MSQTAQEYFEQGMQHCRESQFEKAIKSFDQVLASEPYHKDTLYNKAKALYKLKEFDTAIETFDTLILVNPNNAHFLSERAVALHLNKRHQEALADLDKAVELEPEKPFRYSSRAFIKDRLGDHKGAIADYEKCIELDPEDAIAYNNKGMVEEKLGYIEKSKRSFAVADSFDKQKQDSSVTTENEVKIEATKKDQPQPKVEEPAEEETGGVKHYLKTIKAMVTDKEERKAFTNFIKEYFKG